MVISKLKSYENWYQATSILPNGAIATGYGTTFVNAVLDCVRDIVKIKELQNA